VTLRDRVVEALAGLPVEVSTPRRGPVTVYTEEGRVRRSLARVRQIAATGRDSCDRWELSVPGPEGQPWALVVVGARETVCARLVDLVSVGAEVGLSAHRRRRAGGEQ
jgi:hypothetical protein